jgi:hypothetical protein
MSWNIVRGEVRVSEHGNFIWYRPTVPVTARNRKALFTCSLVAVYSFVLTSIAVLLVSSVSIHVPGAAITIAILVAASGAAAKYPGHAISWYAATYLPLKVAATNYLVGYTTPTYALLAIAIVIFITKPNTPSFSPRLPGLWAAWLFTVVVLAQSLRTTDPGSAMVVACNALCFALLLTVLPRFSRGVIYRTLQYFAFGALGAAPILWLRCAADPRLGESLGLNPNELGCVMGAALLLLTSTMVMPGNRLGAFSLGGLGVVFLARTGSRSAFVGFLFSYALFWLVKAQNVKARLRAVLVLMLFFAAMSALILKFGASASSNRLMSPFTEDFNQASPIRAKMWGYLLQEVPTYWKFGAGLANVNTITADWGFTIDMAHIGEPDPVGLETHDIYLTAILELGVVGLGAMLCWQLAVIKQGIVSGHRSPLFLPMFCFLTTMGLFQGLNFDGLLALLVAGSYAAWGVCRSSGVALSCFDSRRPRRGLLYVPRIRQVFNTSLPGHY